MTRDDARRILHIAFALVVVAFGVMHVITMKEKHTTYTFLTPERIRAIEEAAAVSKTTDWIGSYPDTIGHWIGGMTGRMWTNVWGENIPPPSTSRRVQRFDVCYGVL